MGKRIESFRILLELEKPKSWKETKIFLTYFGWWKASKYFKEKGIITEDGVDEKGRKIWMLTEKGKELVKHIKAIYRILGEDDETERTP